MNYIFQSSGQTFLLCCTFTSWKDTARFIGVNEVSLTSEDFPFGPGGKKLLTVEIFFTDVSPACILFYFFITALNQAAV